MGEKFIRLGRLIVMNKEGVEFIHDLIERKIILQFMKKVVEFGVKYRYNVIGNYYQIGPGAYVIKFEYHKKKDVTKITHECNIGICFNQKYADSVMEQSKFYIDDLKEILKVKRYADEIFEQKN